jgi:anti-anti-sigma factor
MFAGRAPRASRRSRQRARAQHEGGEIGGSPQDALLAATRQCPTLAVIDLRGLDFMDSTGLTELARARRARAEQRRVVRVMGTQPIDRILAISGVERAFETTADPPTLSKPPVPAAR